MDNIIFDTKNLIFDNQALNYDFYTWDANALALIARMTAAGEEPTTARATAINNCIISLKLNNLFTTQFDVLVVTKGKGAASTKMNWISTNFTATNSPTPPTYTEDVGYNTNGTNSKLFTSYTPSTNGVLFTLNDACWGFKVGGSITTNGVFGGYFTNTGGVGTISWYSAAGSYIRLNAERVYACGGDAYQIGYNMLSRISWTSIDEMINDVKKNYAYASETLTAGEIAMLNWNYATDILYPSSNEKLELYYLGKSMTQAQFNTFQTIMNAYFATF